MNDNDELDGIAIGGPLHGRRMTVQNWQFVYRTAPPLSFKPSPRWAEFRYEGLWLRQCAIAGGRRKTMHRLIWRCETYSELEAISSYQRTLYGPGF